MSIAIPQQTLRSQEEAREKNLDSIEENIAFKKFKCQRCYLILDESELKEGKCPQCGDAKSLVSMCRLDHDKCTHEVVDGIAYCDLCGEPVCPQCGSHDVEQISRVTGYLQATSGWNRGKMQELKDRHRYDVGGLGSKSC